MPPSGFAVEEFDATDHPFIAAQVDGPRLAAGLDVVAELNLFTCAVRVTDHHALGLDLEAECFEICLQIVLLRLCHDPSGRPL
jgi:hypothetical protein